MTTSLPGSARAVLDSPALAHPVTLNPDGSPQVTVVWAGLDGDEIVAAHLPEHRKVRNIRSDSRVALSIETATRNAMGLNEYLVVWVFVLNRGAAGAVPVPGQPGRRGRLRGSGYFP